MKHKHKWQFIEEYKPTFISNGYSETGITMDFQINSNGYWTKPTLKFACECGRVKLVLEK